MRLDVWVSRALTAGIIALVAAGCDREPTDTAQPFRTARPGGSRKVQVVYVNGMPQLASSAQAAVDDQAPAPSGVMPAVPTNELKMTWDVPAGWKSVAPSTPMRRAQLLVPRAPGDAEDAELAVYYFGPSGAGGIDETMSRWAGEFDEQDAKAAKRTSLSQAALPTEVLDVRGTYRGGGSMMGVRAASPKPNAALVGAIVQTAHGPYYFKLNGPAQTVAAAREPLLSMIASMRSVDQPAAP